MAVMKQVSKKITVALADDHILLRNALANLVNTFEECAVILEVSDGAELLNALPQRIPDVLLLDLNMPQMDGFETAQWLQQHYPDIKILMLTMFDSDATLIRLLQAGVKGFLKKDIHPTELKFAIQSVMLSGYYYSQATSGKMANLFRAKPLGGNVMDKSRFTEDEIQFMKLSTTELTYKEIAQHLKLNPRAVDNMRDALFQKLEIKSRVALAMYAIKNGLVRM
jgi:two-component system, NarL family, invasion response regulator UvrY